jgi:hypothetical protein
MHHVSYKWVLRPSVDYLRSCGRLMIAADGMAEFLGVPPKALQPLSSGDRIPLPFHLGLGKCARWSVFELLEWVQAGCPRRTQWIESRGRSGYAPEWRWQRS